MYSLALLATAALSLYTVGVEVSLLLLGAWLAAVAVQKALPSWRGPASWAAAVAGTALAVIGASFAAALVSTGPLPRWLHFAMLLLPSALGSIIILLNRGRPGRPIDRSVPSFWVPLVAVFGTLSVAAVVAASGSLHGLAWAMSGDARNHIAISRGLLYSGGPTLAGLSGSPLGANTLLAVVMGADRTGAAGELLIRDARSMAGLYVLAAAAAAVLLAAAVLESVSAVNQTKRTGGLPTAVVALACGLLAGSPLMLGTALNDGFFSGYVALPFGLSAMVLGLRGMRSHQGRAAALAGLTLVTGLVFITWTILVVVPWTATAVLGSVTARALFRDRRTRSTATNLAVGFIVVASVAVLAAIAGLVYLYRAHLAAAFVLPGSSGSVYALALPLLLLCCLAIAAGARSPRLRRAMAIPVTAAVGGIVVLVGLMLLPATGFGWTYYAHKTNWLVTSCLLWAPFVPIAAWAQRASRIGLPGHRALAASAAGALSLVGVLGSLATAPSPLMKAVRGWSQPAADVVVATAAKANGDNPIILWEWSSPGDDRLGNFWLVLDWGSEPSGAFRNPYNVDFAGWAYFETGALSDVCTLAEQTPGLEIATRSADLESRLEAECPDAEATVHVG